VKLNFQKNRPAIIVSIILFLALIGLLFIRTDFVTADQNISTLSQSQDAAGEIQESEFGTSVTVFPSLLRIISALVLVIGAIYGGLYLLKRMMGTKYAGAKKFGNLEVLETIHIGPKKTVSLLRVGEKSVLVGSTDGSMSLLSELSPMETSKIMAEVEVTPSSESFGNLFKSAVEKIKEVTRKRNSTVTQHT
jgi:flagellar biosynthetic protein FliO